VIMKADRAYTSRRA